MAQKFFFLFTFAILFSVGTQPVHAQKDLRCMTQSECTRTRAELINNFSGAVGISALDTDPEAGFLPAKENGSVAKACGANTMYNRAGEEVDAGFCLPISVANTAISINGQQRFSNIADYITFLYSYSIVIASVLAVIMLLVGAVQWTTSAGGEGINQARTRIANALTGLLLISTSYVILYTIDPNLTQLRPPEVYLLRKEFIADPLCRFVEGGPVVFEAGEISSKEQKDEEDALKGEPIPNTEAKCGYEYYIAGVSGQLCQGSFCSNDKKNPQVCAIDKTRPIPEGEFGLNPTCNPGSIVGNINASTFLQSDTRWISRGTRLGIGSIYDPLGIGEGYAYEWVSQKSNIKLALICKNGIFNKVESILQGTNVRSAYEYIVDSSNLNQFYSLTVQADKVQNLFDTNCKEHGGSAGFALLVGFNEFADATTFPEWHFLGNQEGTAVDIGKWNQDLPVPPICMFRTPLAQAQLIPPQDLIDGIEMEIDVSQIADIDTDDISGFLSVLTTAFAEVAAKITLNPLAKWLLGIDDSYYPDIDIVKQYTEEWESAYAVYGLDLQSCTAALKNEGIINP